MITNRVITIEYLAPTISHQLLCKFPDQSAFDFDYTQSGIWSPLLPRGHSRMIDISSIKGLGGSHEFARNKFKRFGSKIKKKMSVAMSMKKKTTVNRRLDFSVSPAPKKGWAKVLKAASKTFKKQKVAPSLRLQNFLNLGQF